MYLGFPYIFRGALDVRATQINEAMKLAAVKALAELAKTPVPDIVNMAYNEKNIVLAQIILFQNHLIHVYCQQLLLLLQKQPWKVVLHKYTLTTGMHMPLN